MLSRLLDEGYELGKEDRRYKAMKKEITSKPNGMVGFNKQI